MTQTKAELLQTRHQGDLKLGDADSTNYVGFKAPATVGSNLVWTLPAADGSSSQYLQTNGSGVLTWSTVSIGGATGIDFNDNVKVRFGTGNDLEIFHNASNSVINDAGTGDLLLQLGGSTKATVSSTGFDITGALTVSTNATITGNLTVSGTTTTVDSVTLSVKDKNIEMGVVSSPSDTTADGGGITLKGATDKTFNWVNATDAWTSSENIVLPAGKRILIGTTTEGHVDGDDLTIASTGNTGITVRSGTSGAGSIYFSDGTSGTDEYEGIIEYLHSSNSLLLRTNHALALTLDSSQNATFAGTVTATSFSGSGASLTSLPAANLTGTLPAISGANLTNLPPSGGSVQVVASGSLTANTAVMVKSDGTVEGISTVSESNGSMGSSSNGSYATGWIRGAFNSSTNKVVVVYQGTYNQYSLKSRVGTVSGNSISWGSEQNVTGGNNEASDPDVIFHPPTGKVLCAYRAQWQSYKGYATVGTISGNSMTWGSNVQWEDTAVNEIACFWDPNVSDRIGIAYTNTGSSSHGKIETALISTTANSCTFPRGGGWGGNTVSASTAARYMRVTKMGDHMAFVYCDQGSSYALRVRGLTWSSSSNNGEYQSGSDSSLGNSGIRPDITWDSNYNALVVSYIVSADGSDTFGLKIGAITGTGKDATFTWSNELGSGSNMFSNRTNGGTSIEFDKKSGKIWCVMCEEGLRHRLITLTSTTTISKESIVDTSTTNNSFYVTIANNMNTSDYNPSPTGKYMVFWYDGSGSSRVGRYVVKQLPSTTLDADRYLGMASASYSNGQTATINVVGGTATGSSLTPNTNYYVQSNGTIGATAANPSVLIGKAYTSTKILIK